MVMEEAYATMFLERCADDGFGVLLDEDEGDDPFRDVPWSMVQTCFLERELKIVRTLHRERLTAVKFVVACRTAIVDTDNDSEVDIRPNCEPLCLDGYVSYCGV